VIAGRYEVVQVLGQGAGGRVELVRDQRDGQLYALKSASLSSKDAISQLEREFDSLCRIGHPQVVEARALRRDESGGTLHLLCDYVPERGLEGTREDLGAQDLARIAALALNALSHVHARGVVHGDLKPAHILVGRDERGLLSLHLVDFGLSVHAEEPGAKLIGGTPAYMPPETMAGGCPTARGDLYALGRSLLEAHPRLLGPGGEAEALEPISALLQALCHEDADLRPDSAWQALQLLGTLAPQAVEALPIANRPAFAFPAIWDELQSAVVAWRAGRVEQPLYLVGGSEGAGKTRLLRELRRRAESGGGSVLSVQVARPAAPLEVVRRVMRQADELAPEGVEPFAFLDIGGRERGSVQSALPIRVLQAAIDHLLVLCRARPLLIMVDGLARDDETTWHFLRLLARVPADAGLLVVVTHELQDTGELGREDEEADVPPETASLARCLRLEPLSGEVTTELLASLSSDPRDTTSLAELAALTAGNPRLATMLGRDAAQHGGDRASDPSELLESLLTKRLEAVGPACCELLADLAVLLRPAPLGLLARFTQLTVEEIRSRLQVLEAESLVESGSEEVGVVNPRVRHVVLGGSNLEEMQARHRRALEAWSQWEHWVDRPAAMLALHAARAGDIDRATHEGRAGIRVLLREGNLRTAESLVLELLDLDLASRPDEHLFLEETLAEVLVRGGQNRRARALLESILARDEIAPADVRARLLMHLGSVEEAQGRYERASDCLIQARQLSEGGASLLVQMRIRERLGAVFFRQGRYEEARVQWTQGLGLAPGGEPSIVRGDLHNNLGILETYQNDFEAAEREHAAALTMRRSLGDLEGEARTHTNMANLALARGRYAAARERYMRSLRIKRQVGSLGTLASTLHNLGILSHDLGELGAAVRYLNEALVVYARANDPAGEAATRTVLSKALAAKGQLGEALRTVRAAGDILERLGVRGAAWLAQGAAEAELAMLIGDFGTATHVLRLRALALQKDELDMEGLELVRLRGALHVWQDRAKRGLRDLYRARRGVADQEYSFQACMTELDIGWAELQAADLGAACAAFESALRIARKTGARLSECVALLGLARCHGETGNADTASRHLFQAQPMAEALGSPLLRFDIYAEKGMQAWHTGRTGHAIGWWRRCAEVCLALLGTLPMGSYDAMFMEHPRRRWVLNALESLVSSDTDAPLPADGAPAAQPDGPADREDESQ
jgi:serine/threonine-protein kinase